MLSAPTSSAPATSAPAPGSGQPMRAERLGVSIISGAGRRRVPGPCLLNRPPDQLPGRFPSAKAGGAGTSRVAHTAARDCLTWTVRCSMRAGPSTPRPSAATTQVSVWPTPAHEDSCARKPDLPGTISRATGSVRLGNGFGNGAIRGEQTFTPRDIDRIRIAGTTARKALHRACQTGETLLFTL